MAMVDYTRVMSLNQERWRYSMVLSATNRDRADIIVALLPSAPRPLAAACLRRVAQGATSIRCSSVRTPHVPKPAGSASSSAALAPLFEAMNAPDEG
jgi:hypothetical protein